MQKQDLLYGLIELIILLIPIGGLIWKAAKQAGKIDDMEKELTELKMKVVENEKQSEHAISELKNSINALDKKIDVNNEKVLTSLEFITEQIKEMKK